MAPAMNSQFVSLGPVDYPFAGLVATLRLAVCEIPPGHLRREHVISLRQAADIIEQRLDLLDKHGLTE